MYLKKTNLDLVLVARMKQINPLPLSHSKLFQGNAKTFNLALLYEIDVKPESKTDTKSNHFLHLPTSTILNSSIKQERKRHRSKTTKLVTIH